MADDEIFTAATGQGLVVSTGILGDLVLPEGTFDPDGPDEIRDLAAQAAVYATQASGTLRAYRSAWRQYDAWCTRLGLSALSRRSPPGRHVPDRRGRAPRLLRDNQNPSSSDNLAYIRWWSNVRWASWCQAPKPPEAGAQRARLYTSLTAGHHNSRMQLTLDDTHSRQ